MTDPTIVTLRDDFPDDNRDDYYVRENLHLAGESLKRIPTHYADATVTVPEIANWVHNLIGRAAAANLVIPSLVSGPSLLLVGATGTGKTHQAYGVIRALCVSGVRPSWKFATAADIYAKLRPRHGVDSEAEFDRYANARLLVIDDLGAAKSTEWNEEVNYRLINHRYEYEMPSLITSNVPPAQLRDSLGERVTSRLAEMAVQIVLKGDDRRRKAA